MKLRKTRIALDIVLTATIIFEMLYALTGNTLHEIVGMVFFATLVAHMAISFKWIKAMNAKSRTEQGISLRRKAMLVVCVAIAVIGALLLVSSLLISNVLASLTGWQLIGTPYLAAAYLHKLLAYALCVAAVVHVALHWASLFNVMRIPYDAGKRNAINVGVSSVAAIGVLVLGATAARALDVLPASSASASEKSPSPSASSQPSAPQAPSDAGNAPESTESVNGAQSNGSGRGATNRKRLDSSGSATQSAPESSAPSTSAPSDNGASGNSSSSGDASSSVSGYCTLCHKHCPLSAPQCNKPYAAGLL